MTATNTNSIIKNRDGYANYQHAPEEQDMDLLVVFLTFFFFLFFLFFKKSQNI